MIFNKKINNRQLNKLEPKYIYIYHKQFFCLYFKMYGAINKFDVFNIVLFKYFSICFFNNTLNIHNLYTTPLLYLRL